MMRRRWTGPLILIVVATTACSSGPGVDSGASIIPPTTISVTDEELSDAPRGLATIGSTPGDDQSDSTPVEEPVPTEPERPLCEAPSKQTRFVDVQIDDPDGGLNMRTLAGVNNPILTTIERGKELITTGACTTLGTVDWWEVTTSDGTVTGWVSSRFLSASPVLTPGLGAPAEDPDVDGLIGETADDLIAILADRYGFGDNAEITFVDGFAHDAQSATAIYDVTGLEDDSSSGFRFEIEFFILREDDADGEQIGVEGYRVVTQALCSQGVTDDGLCV